MQSKVKLSAIEFISHQIVLGALLTLHASESAFCLLCLGWVRCGQKEHTYQHLPLRTKLHQSLEFIAERWTGDPRYKNDKLAASQPLSIGARSRVGKMCAPFFLFTESVQHLSDGRGS